MKLNKTLTALAVSASFGLSGQAFAEGTIAGTDVTNTVTLGYTVNTVAQTDLTQTATFKVDTKVNFTLTMDETETVKVTPNGSGYIANYTLTSTSNDLLGFELVSADLATGSQPFDLGTPVNLNDTVDLNANISLFVESGTTVGYQVAEDTATAVTNLAADGTAEVYVIVDTAVPGTFVDKDIASIALTVNAKQPDGSTNLVNNNNDAFIAGTKQFVIVKDTLTKNTAFEVGSAKFTDPDDGTDAAKFTIDVTVINDPLCETALTSASTGDFSAGACPNMPAAYIPKAIPGAMVKYTLKAKNSGSVAATNVSFVEDLADIGNADSASGDVNLDLVQNTLGNVAVNFTGAGTDTDASTANVLTVNVDTFAKDDEITIDFTAIVE
ncbi:hypothetical protein ACU6U9_21320 [Pseudomonas sp. HK3]